MAKTRPLQDLQDLRHVLREVLVRISAIPGFQYRLVGTSAALLQGVLLPTGDIDILVKTRQEVDAFAAACADLPCLAPPSYLVHAKQYYAAYAVDRVEVGVSTVEVTTDSDCIECLGRGPWEHWVPVECGGYIVPAVSLELRLVSELARQRPDRAQPLLEHMRRTRCDRELVRRGMVARGLSPEAVDGVLAALGGPEESEVGGRPAC